MKRKKNDVKYFGLLPNGNSVIARRKDKLKKLGAVYIRKLHRITLKGIEPQQDVLNINQIRVKYPDWNIQISALKLDELKIHTYDVGSKILHASIEVPFKCDPINRSI